MHEKSNFLIFLHFSQIKTQYLTCKIQFKPFYIFYQKSKPEYLVMNSTQKLYIKGNQESTSILYSDPPCLSQF